MHAGLGLRLAGVHGLLAAMLASLIVSDASAAHAEGHC